MHFGEFVRRRHAAGALVVQPRMGFADPALMRAGLVATRGAAATTVGTITLDSFTRLGDPASATRALREGTELNGYPILSHALSATRRVLAGVHDGEFPVQVRHGSARPQDITRATVAAGLHATEGGPVSYCLPYGRTPLTEAVRNWRECCELLLGAAGEPHLETFGGCMMGQLCPPSQLVAISVLEAMFFQRHGIRSVSVSYAQQTHPAQDREAVAALRRLCAELLLGTDWHVVIYAYMGRFPRTADGARNLLARAAELAVSTGAQRLIVKTVAEAERIPTIAENVAALEHAAAAADRAFGTLAAGTLAGGIGAAEPDGGQVYREARALVDAVLDCAPDIGNALVRAFARGLLDIPYCLHPANAGRARGRLDADGRLGWADIGALPLAGVVGEIRGRTVSSSSFLSSLSYVRDTYDTAALTTGTLPALSAGHLVQTAERGDEHD
ncbi:Glutamate mutase subunit E [Frankia torreyi]|uniref:Glutamate mutase subunit E n=2 Tax=Frankia TaxID=1854 RepID=A0A0D8BBG4_9ACTN|nr:MULTISPECIES: methylaspartate mutase [Frankia]KJE21274.1 Glutamate mutase subunit E [Frankia torreyi]